MDRLHLLREFASCALSLHLDLGAEIFRQGDSGDAFYIVKSGRLRVIQDNESKAQTVSFLYAGDHFGEGALLTDKMRRATVRVAEPVELLKVKKADFLKVISSNSDLKRYLEDQVAHIAYRNFTRHFKGGNVPPKAIQNLFGSLKQKKLSSGAFVIQQGNVGDKFYLIGSGRLMVVDQNDSGQEEIRYELMTGDFFCETTFQENASKMLNVTAVTDVVLYFLDKADFENALEHIPVFRLFLEEIVANNGQGNSRNHLGNPMFGASSENEQADEKEHRSEVIALNETTRQIHRFPFLKQRDETDCGAACLGMICKHYGMSIGLNRLRDMANVSQHGATLAGLAEAAENLGFITSGVRTSYEHLMRAALPAVIHWQGNHFIVLFRITSKYVMVADPGIGIRKLYRKEFETGWTRIALLLDYTTQVAENEPSHSSFRRFLPLIRPYITILSEILLASLLLSLFGLAAPIFTQIIVDKVLVHHDRSLLNLMLMGMIIIALFQIGTQALRTYLIAYVSSRLSITMLSRFYQHLLRVPMRFFALRRTGDLITRFQENATIQSLLTGATVSAILDVMMLFIYLGIMLYYHVGLATVVMAFIPLSVILTLIYTPILKSISQRIFLARAEQSSVLIDSLRGIDIVKAMAVERDTRWEWGKRYTKEIKIGFHGIKIEMLFASLGSMVNTFSSTFILWYGANLVMDGELTVGQLMAFNALIGNVMGPILGLIKLWPQVQEARIALDRLNDIYDTPIETSRHGDYAVTLQSVDGRVSFEKVFFRYGVGAVEPHVLVDIDLEVARGQKVAVVGRSGAGKTTLVKLVPRFFDPTEGRVMLDGIDLKDFDPRWLRRQVGMVLQEPFLFSGTIAENIALGGEDIEMDRVIEVAQLANAHEFVTDLTLGYETKVGEQGVGLSGGQRQRLAIARALYSNPSILIFDEATNAIDVESEQAIQENLEEIMKDRTVFIIAHRLNTVQDADLIVVLDKGQIAEMGNHESLMTKQGLYYYLTSQQLSIA